MKLQALVMLLIGFAASAETKCEDCWTDQCKDLKAYFKKCGAAAVAECPAGMAKSEDTAGNCCWPGQAWAKSTGKCVGEPECPAGSVRKGQACAVAQAAPRQQVSGVNVVTWVEHGAFKLAKTETTVSEYQACVKAGACTPADSGDSCNWGKRGKGNHPINCVDWHQAIAFCTWAGARLPTAAEWQQAGTNDGSSEYPWGEAAPSPTRAKYESEDGTAPVGSFPSGASRKGVLDLAGNVWEWTATDFGASSREVRGGSWDFVAAHLRATDRTWWEPAFRSENLGFRCAR